MDNGPTLTWREVVNHNHCTLVDELTVTLDSAFAAQRDADQKAAAAEVERVRLTTAESLNQILRRIRQAASEKSVLQLLAEATSAYAQRVVVLAIENNQDENTESHLVAQRGTDEQELTFEAASAAAVASVIETKDPLVAVTSASEISQPLADALTTAEGKVYLFPIAVRQEVIAVLLAAGAVVPAPLELICGAAGLKMETLAPLIPVLKALPREDLVQIGMPAERREWKDLSAEDQKLHLQAQRVARVKVAEMRLYQAEQLRNGLAAGNIYGALRVEIDKARTAFLQAFLSKSPTIVDYLHVELVRSLAHDNDRLLGEDYPGPMV